MAIINSFGYVANPDARILILGSMPGKVSLAKQQYYGHPQNLFWPFISELFGADPALPYETRLEILTENGIALWDVLQECYRETSLDNDIVEHSIKPNDFESFFSIHPHIHSVFFNGAKAESTFKKYVGITSGRMRHIQFTKLPSTSPANASITRSDKLEKWAKIKLRLLK